MKKTLLIFIILFAFVFSWAQQTPVTKANYDLAARFSPTKVDKLVLFNQVMPNWLKNSDKFWYIWRSSEGTFYYIVDPVTGKKSSIFDNAKLAAQLTEIVKDPYDAQNLPIQALKLKDDNTFSFQVRSTAMIDKVDSLDKKDTLKGKPRKLKKLNKVDKVNKIHYFEYDIQTKKLTEIADYKPTKSYPGWGNVSPDKKHVVFSRNFNLWYMDMANFEKAREDSEDSTIVEYQLTTEGTAEFGFGSGNSDDDVTEKEKNKRRGAPIIWSPDSKRFILLRTNTENVKDLWVINSLAEPRPKLEKYKYQMPGETGAPVRHLYVYNMGNKEMKEINVSAFKDEQLLLFTKPSLKETMYDTIVHSIWQGDINKFYLARISRDQKRIDFCTVDITTDSVKPIIEERMNTYVEMRKPKFAGDNIIWWSERSGWAHLYLYDTKGNLINQITSGEFHVEDVVAVDPVKKVIYFIAKGREIGENPYYAHQYCVNFDGSNLKLLNPGNYDSFTSTSETGKYFVNNYSRVNTVPKSSLMDNNGKVVVNLEETDLSPLFDMGYKFPEPFTVKAGDGVTDLYGVMYKPFDFDSTKLYPIIEYVYPGPQTESVNTSWSSRMDRIDRLAQLGFIVISVGNRGGHPSRSKWYHNYGYGNLRDYGLEDKKVVIEKLAAKYKFIDIHKVGIHGHSGGGFMSTAAMLVYPDFFKVAVSCAGNHENNIYNRWWGEQHQGVQEKISAKGDTTFIFSVDKNSQIAKNLKGHLLLVVGDVDNNVHPANTLRMVNALIKSNKRFDMLVLPGQRHSFGSMTEYFFWKMADYFSEYLIGDYRDEVEIPQMNNN